jgi:hypothetical protein
MKYKIACELTDAEGIIHGLVLSEDGNVSAARTAKEQADRQLLNAEHRLHEATALVDRVKAAVPQGRATGTELHQAMQEQRACALVLPQHKRGVEVATAEIARAEIRARARIVEIAEQRWKELQAVADQVAPVLNRLRQLETALDEAVEKATRTTSAAGTVLNGQGIRALTWPASLEDDALSAKLITISGGAA